MIVRLTYKKQRSDGLLCNINPNQLHIFLGISQVKNKLRQQGCGTFEDYVEYSGRNMRNVEVLMKIEAKRYLFS